MKREDEELKEHGKKVKRLFLTLWDKAVGAKNYNKKEWIELQKLLERVPKGE